MPFLLNLGIASPIFIGASDGGMVAQIYTQKYPNEVGGLVLVSTGGMDAATLKTLKKKYFFVPLALWYMAHCNYEKLKPRLIQSGMSHLRNESAEEAAYARDMFETIFKDFQQAKDMHITGLLEDLMNQTPVTEADFRALKGRILLIFPNQDFFSDPMQQDLIKLMQGPQIVYRLRRAFGHRAESWGLCAGNQEVFGGDGVIIYLLAIAAGRCSLQRLFVCYS